MVHTGIRIPDLAATQGEIDARPAGFGPQLAVATLPGDLLRG